ncbi:hypothetical protein Syun_012629 [Stephania yunnanensis]|uniref:Uncharacterized protein n=1 Tax=Stephania yunnanensis TaxID=152371 RepID=A0AAP0PHQ4_9MAGN
MHFKATTFTQPPPILLFNMHTCHQVPTSGHATSTRHLVPHGAGQFRLITDMCTNGKLRLTFIEGQVIRATIQCIMNTQPENPGEYPQPTSNSIEHRVSNRCAYPSVRHDDLDLRQYFYFYLIELSPLVTIVDPHTSKGKAPIIDAYVGDSVDLASAMRTKKKGLWRLLEKPTRETLSSEVWDWSASTLPLLHRSRTFFDFKTSCPICKEFIEKGTVNKQIFNNDVPTAPPLNISSEDAHKDVERSLTSRSNVASSAADAKVSSITKEEDILRNTISDFTTSSATFRGGTARKRTSQIISGEAARKPKISIGKMKVQGNIKSIAAISFVFDKTYSKELISRQMCL